MFMSNVTKMSEEERSVQDVVMKTFTFYCVQIFWIRQTRYLAKTASLALLCVCWHNPWQGYHQTLFDRFYW